jgi:OPA family glycerol-3-phosphate transporter-like MFS transporter
MGDARISHSGAFRARRFWNWFPMGLTYALLYMGRYNLTVSKNALGDLMPKSDFGWIFGIGAVTYAVSFLVNGPLVDRIGGKRGILIGAAGAGLANLALGLYLYYVLGLADPASAPLKWVFLPLYAVNMYFQSYGAVSIVKVNASWFHVRERGTFSGIFGIMISSGIFLAFDVTARILASPLVVGQGFDGGDALWWAFLAPAVLLFVFFVIELFLLRDRPSGAGHADFETGDASRGADLSKPVPTGDLFRRILTHPVILTVAFIEFCTGVLRNGVMHWFPIYAQERITAGVGHGFDFALANWGLILMVAGVVGGNVAGIVSDKLFQSRRAPSAGFLYGLLTACAGAMLLALDNGWGLGALVFVMSICVIGTHGLLSGTATMDFGGRQGAATAVGVIDGFVYLGTGLQSIVLGYITERDWSYWPVFLVPFGIIGFLLLLRIWHAKPSGAGGH